MDNLVASLGVLGVIAIIVGVIILSVLFGGLVVLAVWHIFHLASLVGITYWQACGIAFLLAGAGSSNTVAAVNRNRLS